MKILEIYSSSIGKKMTMATTGLLLLLFLSGHAAGNATLYLSPKIFQDYADSLHSHPLIIGFFSLSVFAIFVTHVLTGIILFVQNWKNRYSRYSVSQRVVRNSFASKTMGYTGFLILIFLLLHVWSFTLNKGDTDISELVAIKLNQLPSVTFYICSFFVLAIHLSHGFFSMLQTLGINHPLYNDLIHKFSYFVAAFFLLTFGGIPLLFIFG